MNDDSHISDQLADIQRTLGTLIAQNERADEDRKDVSARVAALRTDITIFGQLAALARAEIEALHKVVHNDVKPQTDEFKKLRLMGSGFVVAVGLAAATFGIAFADLVKAFFTGLRRALGG